MTITECREPHSREIPLIFPVAVRPTRLSKPTECTARGKGEAEHDVPGWPHRL